ncbi:TIGR03084 family metal-binding protein [Streptomyces kronopolitis]|uniref:TIGR03084 family metal-binding protein n=1 Tax=Streptomyces kronopolitis TaxID=1612435 RepID=UPI003434B5C8
MSDPGAVLADLRAESEELDALVAELPAGRWAAPTPAEGWTITHQIAHLAWTDRQALLSATDPDGFARAAQEAFAAPLTFVDEAAEAGARTPPALLLDDWRAGRARLLTALAERPAGEKLPWYGPPMSVASMATARLMETWAHGQDVADALGVTREPTARLRHIARIGVRTRDFAYATHQLAPPNEEFRVELRAPDGGAWEYGPADAAQRVTGEAREFCLLVTQRAHRRDLPSLHAEGPDAERWLGIAQAFAGPPGKGRAPSGKGPTA